MLSRTKGKWIGYYAWRREEETKSRTRDFKKLFKRRNDFDTNHSELRRFSQSGFVFSPIISRFSDPDTIKERDLEPCDP